MNRCRFFISKLTIFFYIQWLFSHSASAQAAAFVGYTYSQNRDMKVFNTIIDHYNTLHPTLLEGMSRLNFLHGIDLGVEYRFPVVNVHFAWINKLNQIKDNAINSNNEEYRNTIYYKNQTYNLGFAFYHQRVGMGTSLDWNVLVLRKENSVDKIKEDWLKQRGVSSHIFLNFDFPVNDLAMFRLRPYVQLPWYKNDFYAVDSQLNPLMPTFADLSAYKQRVFNWGIKLLLVNNLN